MATGLSTALDRLYQDRRARETIPTPHQPGIGVMTLADRQPVTVAVFEKWAWRLLVVVAFGFAAIAGSILVALG